MTVHLVGAGPGDPDLLTVKALRLLQGADVVVYDRLCDPAVLALASPHAELIDVGKIPGQSATQELISALLVHLGREGREVVRLKGGDPFVFGRGGEEALALATAGVPFTMVPGVSSSVAGPAAASIPVTHRGVARSVTTVTGTVGDGTDAPEWPVLARLVCAGGTLVILMGVANRDRYVRVLLDGRVRVDMPVAIIERATTPDQRIVRTTLGELPHVGVSNPAIIVIGEVVHVGDELRALAESAVASSVQIS
jgi:uroporphyrin-III C-methyltransferase